MPEDKSEQFAQAAHTVSENPGDIDALENLIKKVEELPPPTVGTSLKITKTDRIKVHYAQMPITDLEISYLYQVLEPIALIPQMFRVTFQASMVTPAIECMKLHILSEYRSNFVRKRDRIALCDAGYGWMISLNEVDLIECDLLVPRKKLEVANESEK